MMIELSCVLDVEHHTTFRRHVAHQARFVPIKKNH